MLEILLVNTFNYLIEFYWTIIINYLIIIRLFYITWNDLYVIE